MAEKPTERQFEVLSKKYVEGKVGEVITLSLTDNQEKSLLESGAVKRAAVRPVAVVKERK
jgi:hypothetical protein